MGIRVHEKRPAPAVRGVDQSGALVDLQNYRGKWIVLYFYPKDETAGCTREACGFRDEFAALRREGAVVIGVSRDSIESHRAFANHHDLPFQLLSDSRGEIQDAFGARGFLGVARRHTFLIDPHGVVVKTYKVRPWSDHAKEVLADLRAQKTAIEAQEPTKAESLNHDI